MRNTQYARLNTQDIYKIEHISKHATGFLTENLNKLLDGYIYNKLIVICIGTDRSTGDSLGPLVGTRLSKSSSTSIEVFGTLKNPVHALNLRKTIAKIDREFPDDLVLAIDASLGTINSVGTIQIVPGAIRPGSAIDKDLPEAGDISITGVVNICGTMGFDILQSTRLYTVMKMAKIISDSIHNCVLQRENIQVKLKSSL